MSEKKTKALGAICGINQHKNCIILDFEHGHGEITLLTDNIMREKIYLGDTFNDKTKGKILAIKETELDNVFTPANITIDEKKEYYLLNTDNIFVKIFKSPYRLEAYHQDGKLYFKEKFPLSISEKQTIQVLEGYDDEYFYGGGVQNGYFSHKGRTIAAELKVSHWNAGSSSNPVPFYLSTNGYGQFRNTFCPGSYAFLSDTTLIQKEGQLDAFYFFGETPRDVLDLYTQLTGRPHLIPRWGLLPGDSNAYKETMDALKTVQGYVEHDIPRGWVLPNDGYGCGYTDLKGFIKEAEKLGFHVGLWTENSMDKIKQEVSEFGSRMVKTDVAWVGPGYEFALDGVKMCHHGIEDNCDSRSYLWTCCGWAGTQRYSTVWSGDQFGNWEYIRMHIPTYIGSGLSGNPYCGSDIDGIFEGSVKTHVRDLQWKCFTPILIQMSGWAPKNKQAWVWGEPYTSINRKYINLKFRLTPYMYTHAYESSLDATPIMRPMFWNYGNDKYLLNKDTQYQFMLGDSFLVAPVFEDADKRDAIYLPDEEQYWIDYFTGDQYKGGQVINSFDAPLEKLPLFVKSGSIIPMYPLGRFDGDKLPDEKNPLTIDIYPNGEQCFNLYEDDGYSKEYRNGEYAITPITAVASMQKAGNLSLTIGAAKGSYKSMKENRRYEFTIHTKTSPKMVEVNGIHIDMLNTKQEYDLCNGFGLFYDKDILGGVLFIKTQPFSVREKVNLIVENVDNCPVPIEVTDDVIPEIPSGLFAEEVFDCKNILRWQAVDNAKWYDLEIDGLLFSHVSNPYVHRELEPTTEYKYKIRACNTKGVSPWSNEITVQTLESSSKYALTDEEMVASATSERPGYGAYLAINGDGESMWLSVSKDKSDLPCTFKLDFKDAYKINKFAYKSRPKGTRGNITKYNLLASIDGIHYKTLIKEGLWDDQDELHEVDFGEEVLQHMKIEILEGLKGFANAIHFTPYRVHGTDKVTLGNYTGGNEVDNNDLTFVKNYIGVFEEDNDWGYVSKCDINYNGMIDAYDLAFVTSKLDGGLIISADQGEGEILISTNLPSVKAGEAFEVEVIGKKLKNIYGFHAMINVDADSVEPVYNTNKSDDEVIATSSELTKGLINASTVKSDENGSKVVVAFCGKGNSNLINGDGNLATFTLRALKDIDNIKLSVISTMLVDGKLNIVK